MLAALEHGVVEDVIDCQPRYAVYQGIVDHVRRAANKVVRRDSMGPQFVLDESGQPVYFGQYEGSTALLPKPEIMRALFDLRVTRSDLDRFIAIIEASQKRIDNQYPGTEFHVLF